MELIIELEINILSHSKISPSTAVLHLDLESSRVLWFQTVVFHFPLYIIYKRLFYQGNLGTFVKYTNNKADDKVTMADI